VAAEKVLALAALVWSGRRRAVVAASKKGIGTVRRFFFWVDRKWPSE